MNNPYSETYYPPRGAGLLSVWTSKGSLLRLHSGRGSSPPPPPPAPFSSSSPAAASSSSSSSSSCISLYASSTSRAASAAADALAKAQIAAEGGELLLNACKRKDAESALRLFNAGADPNVVDEFGQSPLMRVAAPSGVWASAPDLAAPR